jgi:formylglycine-generating enzyme required for sulfatase activity
MRVVCVTIGAIIGGLWPLATSGQPEPAGTALFADCAECPTMVVVPSGTFVMGASSDELRRENVGADYASWEQPQHEVVIPWPLAVATHETTRAQFAAFVHATGHDAARGCHADFGSARAEFQMNETKTWQEPGFVQSDDDPVVCVSWDDARTYAAWLAAKIGKAYRLPTEAEWEYFARAGSAAARHWGDDRAATCRFANGTDATAMRQFGWTDAERASPCDDGFAHTAPVGSFAPNAFGLHDVLGNAWEWVEDCFVPNYVGAPSDGRARITADCPQRVFRGGGWLNSPVGLRSAARGRRLPDGRFNVGFRVVRAMEP